MLNLIRNPIVFQGAKKLNKNSNYFEGWYFKNSTDNYTISFIPGISIEKNNQSCFIQVITIEKSYYIPYSINDFKFTYEPFSITIGNNYFSETKLKIDISYNDLEIKGELEFSKNVKLNKTLLAPNIMGPFSYVPNMECNHAILSLKHDINGILKVNEKIIRFENGTGYIEKDWGTSFPKSYLWCQGNSFENKNASLFLSIADIPFKFFSFTGFICTFYLDGKEYRFTTYNGSKIISYRNKNNTIKVALQKKDYKIFLVAEYVDSSNLLAPQNGNMSVHVSESVNSKIKVTLSKDDHIVFDGWSKNCGVEVCHYW